MTVSSISPVNNYRGNSSNTQFDFDFLIEDENELIVQHTTADGRITILKSGTDYSINEIGNENGSYIIFPLANSNYSVLAENETISLMLTLTIKQEKEIRNSLFFNFSTLEWMFDYIVRILQILSRKIERCVKVDEGSNQTADELVKALNEARESAADSASQAANYAMDLKNKVSIKTFETADWELSDGYYILQIPNIVVINAVYKINDTKKEIVSNIDAEIDGNMGKLKSPAPFDGYVSAALYE